MIRNNNLVDKLHAQTESTDQASKNFLNLMCKGNKNEVFLDTTKVYVTRIRVGVQVWVRVYVSDSSAFLLNYTGVGRTKNTP